MYICRFILSYSTIYASDLSFMIDTWSVVELKLMHLACTALSVTKRRASQPVTHALNDVVARAFSAAGIPISKTLLYRLYGHMAGRQAGCLGRYGHLDDCTVIFGLIIPRGRRCSRNGGVTQVQDGQLQ